MGLAQMREVSASAVACNERGFAYDNHKKPRPENKRATVVTVDVVVVGVVGGCYWRLMLLLLLVVDVAVVVGG